MNCFILTIYSLLSSYFYFFIIFILTFESELFGGGEVDDVSVILGKIDKTFINVEI